MRIVVTGGAGFIGSHLVDALVAQGHDVLELDSLWSHGGGRREKASAAAQLVEMDICDAGVEAVFARFKPEAVYHEAAQHSVAIGTRDPKYDADVNVLGTLNVLEAACKAGVRKVFSLRAPPRMATPSRCRSTRTRRRFRSRRTASRK